VRWACFCGYGRRANHRSYPNEISSRYENDAKSRIASSRRSVARGRGNVGDIRFCNYAGNFAPASRAMEGNVYEPVLSTPYYGRDLAVGFYNFALHRHFEFMGRVEAAAVCSETP